MTEPSPPPSEPATSEVSPASATPLADAARLENRRRQRVRFALLGIVLVGLFLLAWALGLEEYFDRERLRALVEDMGAWGPVAFVVLFAVGELVHVPAWVFIGVAVVIWGPVVGGAMGFLGANASVLFSFVIVRAIGGKAFDSIERPFVRRMLARLDEYPILVVAGLRTVLVALPALNYALALSRIRFRDYALGSALGLVIPVTVLTIAFALGLG